MSNKKIDFMGFNSSNKMKEAFQIGPFQLLAGHKYYNN